MQSQVTEEGVEVAAGGSAPGEALVNVPVEVLEGGHGGSVAPFSGVFKAGLPAQGKGVSTPRTGRGAGGHSKLKAGLGGVGGGEKKGRGSKAPVGELGVSGEGGSRRVGGSPSGGKLGKGGGGGLCCGPDAVKTVTTGASKKGGSPGRVPGGGMRKDHGVLGSSPNHPAAEDVTSIRKAGTGGGRGRSRGSPGQEKGKAVVGIVSPAGGRPGGKGGSRGVSGSPGAKETGGRPRSRSPRGARRTLLSGAGPSAQATGRETRAEGPTHGELVTRVHQALRREGGEEESCTQEEGSRSPPQDKSDP